MPAATTAQPSNPFIKQLASSDRTTRDRALASLRTYLSQASSRTTPFAPLELLKLWKGLFFCMWMSDKPLNQQRLARDFADLCTVLKGEDNLVGFLDAFWKTMAREWGGIDALRMDKYLYLVRCHLNTCFELMSRQGWSNEGLIERLLEVLQATPFDPRDSRIPNGLRSHVVDIFVDELEKVDTERTAPVEKILAPVRSLGKDTITKTVRTRVKEALADDRLRDWQGLQSAGSDQGSDSAMVVADGNGDEDEFGGFDD